MRSLAELQLLNDGVRASSLNLISERAVRQVDSYDEHESVCHSHATQFVYQAVVPDFVERHRDIEEGSGRDDPSARIWNISLGYQWKGKKSTFSYFYVFFLVWIS